MVRVHHSTGPYRMCTDPPISCRGIWLKKLFAPACAVVLMPDINWNIKTNLYFFYSFSFKDSPEVKDRRRRGRKRPESQGETWQRRRKARISEDGAAHADLAHTGRPAGRHWRDAEEGVSRQCQPARVLHLLQHLRQCLQNTQAAGLHPHLLPGVPLPPHGRLADRPGRRQRSPLLPLMPSVHHAARGRTSGSDH